MKTKGKRKVKALERRKSEATYWEDAVKLGSSACRKLLDEKCVGSEGDPVEVCRRKGRLAREEASRAD
jgi:hypothetical protein